MGDDVFYYHQRLGTHRIRAVCGVKKHLQKKVISVSAHMGSIEFVAPVSAAPPGKG